MAVRHRTGAYTDGVQVCEWCGLALVDDRDALVLLGLAGRLAGGVQPHQGGRAQLPRGDARGLRGRRLPGG